MTTARKVKFQNQTQRLQNDPNCGTIVKPIKEDISSFFVLQNPMNIFYNADEEGRRSIFPIVNQDLWDRYKASEKQIWVAEEADLSKDYFDELSPDEQLLLKNILAFFNISDSLVIENLAVNFLNTVPLLEAQYFYGLQTFIEQVHQNQYAL